LWILSWTKKRIAMMILSRKRSQNGRLDKLQFV
jgi:hypothetical protein